MGDYPYKKDKELPSIALIRRIRKFAALRKIRNGRDPVVDLLEEAANEIENLNVELLFSEGMRSS